MPFLRIILVIVAVMGLALAGLAFFRATPDTAPPPVVGTETPRPRPVVTAPQAPRDQPVMSPGDASSPAEMTAREAAEAQARLEKEQQDEMMSAPVMAPPDLVKN